MSTVTLYRHPDGEGTIQFNAESGRLSLINEGEDLSAYVLIGPEGLRDVAARLLALADANAAECAGAELGHNLLNELLALRGTHQADALRAVHDKLRALNKLEPFDRAAGGFAVVLVNVLEVGVTNLPKVEGCK